MPRSKGTARPKVKSRNLCAVFNTRAKVNAKPRIVPKAFKKGTYSRPAFQKNKARQIKVYCAELKDPKLPQRNDVNKNQVKIKN